MFILLKKLVIIKWCNIKRTVILQKKRTMDLRRVWIKRIEKQDYASVCKKGCAGEEYIVLPQHEKRRKLIFHASQYYVLQAFGGNVFGIYSNWLLSIRLIRRAGIFKMIKRNSIYGERQRQCNKFF
jgi:hypothetical protein